MAERLLWGHCRGPRLGRVAPSAPTRWSPDDGTAPGTALVGRGSGSGSGSIHLCNLASQTRPSGSSRLVEGLNHQVVRWGGVMLPFQAVKPAFGTAHRTLAYRLDGGGMADDIPGRLSQPALLSLASREEPQECWAPRSDRLQSPQNAVR